MAKEANVVQADDKWGKFAGGCLVGEQYVDLTIPKDKINPTNHFWLCLNGDEGYLAVGKKIKVPYSIFTLWQNSYNDTNAAEEMINVNNEIHS